MSSDIRALLRQSLIPALQLREADKCIGRGFQPGVLAVKRRRVGLPEDIHAKVRGNRANFYAKLALTSSQPGTRSGHYRGTDE